LVNTSSLKESTKPSSATSPALLKTWAEGLMLRMASLVWSRVFGLISVIAIREQPERAKPLATAAPMPVCRKYAVRTWHQLAITNLFLQRL
jgi:hypothetical protein